MDLKGSQEIPQTHLPGGPGHAILRNGESISAQIQAVRDGHEDLTLAKRTITPTRPRGFWVALAATLSMSAIVFLLLQCSVGLLTRHASGNSRRLAQAPLQSCRPDGKEDPVTAQAILDKAREWIVTSLGSSTRFKVGNLVATVEKLGGHPQAPPALLEMVGGWKTEISGRLPFLIIGSTVEVEARVGDDQPALRLTIRFAGRNEEDIDTDRVHEWVEDTLRDSSANRAELPMGGWLFKLRFKGHVRERIITRSASRGASAKNGHVEDPTQVAYYFAATCPLGLRQAPRRTEHFKIKAILKDGGRPKKGTLRIKMRKVTKGTPPECLQRREDTVNQKRRHLGEGITGQVSQ
ncbi:hypothetical protein, conserved [Eimeria brunetti]|uniref:Uncharacterized protein n=1 Tax=Eimeria brunetti TaxID=51314 RepID=U6LJQ7_9EIME|nr:hypothetical protein, conserved [Eimeria brunetti]